MSSARSGSERSGSFSADGNSCRSTWLRCGIAAIVATGASGGVKLEEPSPGSSAFLYLYNKYNL